MYLHRAQNINHHEDQSAVEPAAASLLPQHCWYQHSGMKTSQLLSLKNVGNHTQASDKFSSLRYFKLKV